jgi:hypothetical protein
MKQIKEIIDQFNKVSLSDLDKVELMNRVDIKYFFHNNLVPEIFNALKDNYFALEINGLSMFGYNNIYYDTPDNQMYLSHHNGKLNRYKIRVRKYNQTNVSYLEIKFKNNKGRTIKNRIKRKEFEQSFDETELEFIKQHSPFDGNTLKPRIINDFYRITLVNRAFTERVTIDFAPDFRNSEKELTLNNLVIVEVKQDRATDLSQFTKLIHQYKVENHGFSKYCIGRSLLENIKKNNFKPLILTIKKLYIN